ncbi:MAG: hypothetical protein J7J94_01990 [Thaumarchaeota archaeon]|nr:hypothetical protein [Nitrososphaerota archaeon]
MPKFKLRCRICGKTFDSYEEHAEHVFSEHPDQLWARFKPEIIEEGE